MSIKTRLLLWLLLSLLGVSTIFIIATYSVERAGIDYHQDGRLRQIALGIPPTLKSADLRSINVKLFHDRDDFLLQIWRRDQEVYRSTIDKSLPRFSSPGFSVQNADGEAWKLYVRQAGDYTIQVAQSLNERNALARERALHLVVPLILLIIVIALCIPFSVRAGLASLRRISTELDARHLDRLVPLDPAGEPEEILPLVDALNTLLHRLERAAGVQQQFIADASHELRTPLAGLQLQVEMVERAPDDAARVDAVAALKANVKRSTRLVDQLLTTSRLDALSTADPHTIPLNAIVRDALMRLAPLAEARGMDIGLTHDDEAAVAGVGDEILLLVLNLIENAIRYTGDGGQVDVSIRTTATTATLIVEDSGPGIPEADRSRVFDRFFRGRNQAIAGSGLGLAIVKRIADRHAATLSLADSAMLGGLSVTAVFPRAVAQNVPVGN